AGLRLVILQVPVGGDEGLPDAAQIGMTVRAVGRPIKGKRRVGGRSRTLLARRRDDRQREENREESLAAHSDGGITHVCCGQEGKGYPSYFSTCIPPSQSRDGVVSC